MSWVFHQRSLSDLRLGGVMPGKGAVLVVVPPTLHPPGAGSEGKREGNLPNGKGWEPSLFLQEE